MIDTDDYVLTHSTKAEMKFIDGLGSYSEVGQLGRPAILSGYLNGCFHRVNWNGMDPLKIIRYASSSLAACIPHEEGYHG